MLLHLTVTHALAKLDCCRRLTSLVCLVAAQVHPNGAELQLADGETLSTRIVLDCMGHGSPAVQQLRKGVKPDGVCLVVGTLASGFDKNDTADVIYTHTDSQPAGAAVGDAQYFWEAFPAGGRCLSLVLTPTISYITKSLRTLTQRTLNPKVALF